MKKYMDYHRRSSSLLMEIVLEITPVGIDEKCPSNLL